MCVFACVSSSVCILICPRRSHSLALQIGLSDELARVAVAFGLSAAATAELGLAGLGWAFEDGGGEGSGEGEGGQLAAAEFAALRRSCEAEAATVLQSLQPQSRGGARSAL